jgi:hypothetical protein
MTACDFLRKHGPAEAVFIARCIDAPLEEVYTELVHAESRGRVRLSLRFSGGKVVSRRWIAL